MAHRALFRAAPDADKIHTLGVEAGVLARGKETDGYFELLATDFPTGFVLPPHRHPWAEFYVVTGGALDVTIGRRTQTIRPGDLAYVPPNAVHTIATPDGTCRALLWSSGQRALAMYEDMAANLPPGAPTEELIPQIVAVTERHGLEMLAPVA